MTSMHFPSPPYYVMVGTSVNQYYPCLKHQIQKYDLGNVQHQRREFQHEMVEGRTGGMLSRRTEKQQSFNPYYNQIWQLIDISLTVHKRLRFYDLVYGDVTLTLLTTKLWRSTSDHRCHYTDSLFRPDREHSDDIWFSVSHRMGLWLWNVMFCSVHGAYSWWWWRWRWWEFKRGNALLVRS